MEFSRARPPTRSIPVSILPRINVIVRDDGLLTPRPACTLRICVRFYLWDGIGKRPTNPNLASYMLFARKHGTRIDIDSSSIMNATHTQHYI